MAMELQIAICKLKNWPMFAPKDGVCWGCHHTIPDDGEKLITGCPTCNRSYCE